MFRPRVHRFGGGGIEHLIDVETGAGTAAVGEVDAAAEGGEGRVGGENLTVAPDHRGRQPEPAQEIGRRLRLLAGDARRDQRGARQMRAEPVERRQARGIDGTAFGVARKVEDEEAPLGLHDGAADRPAETVGAQEVAIDRVRVEFVLRAQIEIPQEARIRARECAFHADVDVAPAAIAEILVRAAIAFRGQAERQALGADEDDPARLRVGDGAHGIEHRRPQLRHHGRLVDAIEQLRIRRRGHGLPPLNHDEDAGKDGA